MPKLDANARDQLLLHQFLAGLSVAESKQLQTTGDTKISQDNVERARVLMTTHLWLQPFNDILRECNSWETQVSELTINLLTTTNLCLNIVIFPN